MKVDLLIKNAKIIDGTSNPWYYGGLAIKDDKIVSIIRGDSPEKLKNYEALKTIDAQNKFLSPGFIDVHSHSDFVFFLDSDAQSKLRQGVTTEVIGNCGISGAPYNELSADQVKSFSYGYHPTWESVGQFLTALKNVDKTVNLTPLLGHGTLRAYVMGMENRVATAAELAQMKKILAQALESGYRGMSTGLYFSPGNFAAQSELIALAEVISSKNGVLTSHIRDEGVKSIGFIGAVKEIINIAEKAKVSLEISHLKAFGPDVWGSSRQVLDLIEKARMRGVELTADQYPYLATGGLMASDVLPNEFLSNKSNQEAMDELKDKKVQSELRDTVALNIRRRGGAENQIIANYPADHSLEGRTLKEIAANWKLEPADALFKMLTEYLAGDWISRALNEEDVLNFMQYYAVMISSDGVSLSNSGVLASGNPHPRNYGSYTEVLSNYVRDKKILNLEEAIRKMTSLPAQKFNLKNRGIIDQNKVADLVIFDLEQIKSATFTRPDLYPEGILTVIVNGKIAVLDGKYQQLRAGKIILS
ncbi:amidohydrolase family protein [Halanaerobium sp. ST460_2HS_T2]|uniref:N-acyl-D-amino-acid deacylase family protein n=1 Tax=Halanaerobium sp. ST460_2HS_T2 TaxID=2183914 RepID=UPI000E0159B8|nr:D-aminoacylase [Halanaerobium sp. ST460_2HS_T2]RCW55384.1 N-acyl-D-amino-acid deacylase [Halanaerobium sp. ST460_2HS_T2]